ncbi:MAG: N-acyl homoserine lactonase family protein [Spirochaetota bacterium]
MNYKVHPLLNGFFTVSFSSENDVKFPKVENIPSFSFLITDENNIPILVDTGFDINKIPGSDSTGIIKEKHHLKYNLKKFGFTPLDIKTVIQTHLHWDHSANIGLFPNADIFVQKAEIEGLFNLRKNEETSYSPSHWLDSLSRFRLVQGTCELRPGLKLIPSSGHTEGHQSVEIKTADKTVTLIGDSPFSYEWLWTLIPDEQWAEFKSGDGSRFYWLNKSAPILKEWLKNQPVFVCPDNMDQDMKTSPDTEKKEVKIFSHDPGLIGKEII